MLSLRRDCQELPRLTVFQVIQAGYWVKFSTSNDHASDEPHRLQYCHCERMPARVATSPVHLCGRGPTGWVTSFKLLQILREVQCQLCYLLLGYPVLLAAQSKVYLSHAPNHLQHVMLNLVSVVLMRAAEKHSIQRPGTRRGGRVVKAMDC